MILLSTNFFNTVFNYYFTTKLESHRIISNPFGITRDNQWFLYCKSIYVYYIKL